MRICAWCRGRIGDELRADATFCGKKCRQAAHRFGALVPAAPPPAGAPLRLGVLDPPYPGLARRYYRAHRDFAGEVDHRALLEHARRDFHGWALSTSAKAVPAILGLCRELELDVRVGSWVHQFRRTRSAHPLSSWDALIYAGGRREITDDQPPDSLVCTTRARTSNPDHVPGEKPPAWCVWVFRLLGARAGDELVDVFPGSGSVGRAWTLYTSGGSARRVATAGPTRRGRRRDGSVAQVLATRRARQPDASVDERQIDLASWAEGR